VDIDDEFDSGSGSGSSRGGKEKSAGHKWMNHTAAWAAALGAVGIFFVLMV
jgi:hypothetical protein